MNYEEERHHHIDREGPGPTNEHPDGCWYCGSSQHHSTDCTDGERDNDWSD